MNNSEQAKQEMKNWLITSWACLILAAISMLLAIFTVWTNWGWGIIAAISTLMLFLASIKTSAKADLQEIKMLGWQELEAGDGTEEAKDLYKTLQFQIGMLQHNEEELKFVRSEIERTERDIEANF